MIFIAQLIYFAKVCSNVSDLNNQNKYLTDKLLKQGYWFLKLSKGIIYCKHSECIIKCIVVLKTPMQQGICQLKNTQTL